MNKIASLTLALSLSLPSLASSAAVHSVDYASLSGTIVTFDELGADGLLDGLISSGGVQFGELFDGQELALTKAPRPGEVAQDWFDNLSYGLPRAGLTLLAGAVGANLGVYNYGDADAQALAGIGPQNSDGSDPFGMGALSAKFGSGQSAIGFQVREANGGQGFLNLYRLDGSLIEAVQLGALSNRTYAFARDGGVADIAGFSLTHTDSYYGIAIDKLVGVSAVPEPASAWLLILGLASLLATRSPRLSTARQG